ncbi:ATP-dependent DNA helicase RecG [Gemmatimonadota bacterium]
MTDRLAAPVQYLKGVGPARAAALESAGIRSVEDLIFHAPRRYVDRRHCSPISDLREGEQVTVLGEVLTATVARGRKPRFLAKVSDGTGILECVWFRGVSYVKSTLHGGDLVVLSGKTGFYRGGVQIAHPEFEVLGSVEELSESGEVLEDTLHAGGLIPIYPLTAELRSVGLASRGLRRIMRNALDALKEQVEDTLPDELIERRGLIGLPEALEGLHYPRSEEEAESARRRLAYEELFFMELLLADRSRNVQRRPGTPFRTWGPMVRKYLEGLDFTLTRAQQRVVAEVFEDMGSPYPMNRLLQGDVGCGKTVVAACVLLTAVEQGMQSALMAPTEILADQHTRRLRDEFSRLDVQVHFLSSRLSGTEREVVLRSLRSGAPCVVIGTHALIQQDVDFSALGAVVVDEQHRFGVLQRGALQAKGSDPDVLVMTATPIPRTLAMTLYGDLATSVIDEMPPGRQPVETCRVPLTKREKVIERIGEVLADGKQVYWIFPLVEESEKSDLAAAVESYDWLRSGPLGGFRLGLVHGRLKPEEKDDVMKRFRDGEVDLLVSTTVIEVGVDVAGVTMILIEHAERFGLAQLHQLRGRVGRGGEKATCVLLESEQLTEEGEQRLTAMMETTDGFRIAEADLGIRGPGEFFGTRQHGLPDLRVANLITDQRLLGEAREDAFSALGVALDGSDPAEPSVPAEILDRWRLTLERRLGQRILLADIA